MNIYYLKKIISVAFIILISIQPRYFCKSMDNMLDNSNINTTITTAHRGACLLSPENTLAAIKCAIRCRADYVEIDVQQTKDGVVVLTHDCNLKRTTSVDKYIWDINYDELKNYDVGSHFDLQYRDERIPTLAEVIDLSKGKINLLIEIKQNNHLRDDMVRNIVDLIHKNNLTNKCVIGSKDINLVKEVKKIDSSITTCYITSVLSNDYCNLSYVDIYSINQKIANPYMINKIHSNNKLVFVWTVNDENKIKEMLDLKVDSVITDNPYLVYEVEDIKNNKLDRSIG